MQWLDPLSMRVLTKCARIRKIHYQRQTVVSTLHVYVGMAQKQDGASNGCTCVLAIIQR